ncbi:MAG: hypothetical protein HPY82_20615 [Gammaproteobacteria bacterium]|nr:hypothetical protein [Gammaproteobacteria bacterium]
MDKKYSKRVRYEFIFKSGEEFQYQIDMDPDTLEHPVPVGLPPEWARLDVDKCSICPLKSSVTEYCPLALRIAPILSFAPHPAFESVQIRVHKDNMTIESYTTVQDAYRSLIGLIMATSGCPHTGFFKPMAWFHLPFATQDETLFRACATFLFFQFFDPADPEQGSHFSDLKQVYENIHQVNQQIAKRLRRASASESTLNALTILDIFAQSFLPTLNQSLQQLAFLFKPHINELNFEMPKDV